MKFTFEPIYMKLTENWNGDTYDMQEINHGDYENIDDFLADDDFDSEKLQINVYSGDVHSLSNKVCSIIFYRQSYSSKELTFSYNEITDTAKFIEFVSEFKIDDPEKIFAEYKEKFIQEIRDKEDN
jgi:hypothetical protein